MNSFAQAKEDSLERLFGAWYDHVIGRESSELMYHPIYLTALRGKDTHQYLDRRDWQTGSLEFSGQWYIDMPLLFDLERDLLVIKHPDPSRWDGISLNMENVQQFSLAGHRFRKYSLNGSPNFYDVLFEGEHIQLLAKRSKKARSQVGGVQLLQSVRYFLVKDNQLVPMDGIRVLGKLFPSERSIIQRIRKDQRIRMGKEESIVHFMRSLDAKMGDKK